MNAERRRALEKELQDILKITGLSKNLDKCAYYAAF
jgi:hypothetical protein